METRATAGRFGCMSGVAYGARRAAPLAATAKIPMPLAARCRRGGWQQQQRRQRHPSPSPGGRGVGAPRAGVHDEDLYELLDVDAAAPAEEIRASFRRLQKMYHPDSGVEPDALKSAQLNHAYSVLLDEKARRKYDMRLGRTARSRRQGWAASQLQKPGLVGPFDPEEVILSIVGGDTNCNVEAEACLDASLLVQDWAATLSFGSDVPLPVPIQVDDMPNGARLTFITTTGAGSIRACGALSFEVEDDLDCRLDGKQPRGDDTAERPTCWGVTVKRWRTDRETGPLPGEARILKSFAKAFDLRHSGSAQAGGLQGVLAAAFGAFLPSLPPVGALGGEDGTYHGYFLRRNQGQRSK